MEFILFEVVNCRVFHGQQRRGISTPPSHCFDMVPFVPEFTCACSRLVADILMNSIGIVVLEVHWLLVQSIHIFDRPAHEYVS